MNVELKHPAPEPLSTAAQDSVQLKQPTKKAGLAKCVSEDNGRI